MDGDESVVQTGEAWANAVGAYRERGGELAGLRKV